MNWNRVKIRNTFFAPKYTFIGGKEQKGSSLVRKKSYPVIILTISYTSQTLGNKLLKQFQLDVEMYFKAIGVGIVKQTAEKSINFYCLV